MYGYETNQSILLAYVLWQSENVERYRAGELLEYDELYTLTNKIRKIKESVFGAQMLYLEHEGFLEIGRKNLPKMPVILRSKGRGAALGDFFRKENDKILWKGGVDGLMVLGTWALAIITFLALRKDDNEKMQSLQLQLSTLKSEVQLIKQKQIHTDYELHNNVDYKKGDSTTLKK